MEKIFEKYPKIYYSGLEALDLTRRVKIEDKQKNATGLFNPLELKAGLRADHIADAYYDDAELDWMIYLANDIVDPYYQWYLDENQFENMIVDKYGSIEDAIKAIKFYRNNWAQDDTQISNTHYEDTLSWDEKQYWSPIYGPGAKIIAYQRKRQSWVMNTNRIIQYNVGGYANGEIVDIKVSGEVVGGGEVVVSNATTLFIQHVSGNTIANSTWTKTIVGETSNTSAVANSYTIMQENISNAASKYWRSVSYFDWEVEQNESKKIMNIVDNNLVFDLAEDMRLKLAE